MSHTLLAHLGRFHPLYGILGTVSGFLDCHGRRNRATLLRRRSNYLQRRHTVELYVVGPIRIT